MSGTCRLRQSGACCGATGGSCFTMCILCGQSTLLPIAQAHLRRMSLADAQPVQQGERVSPVSSMLYGAVGTDVRTWPRRSRRTARIYEDRDSACASRTCKFVPRERRKNRTSPSEGPALCTYTSSCEGAET
jgi:hypothetical protein